MADRGQQVRFLDVLTRQFERMPLMDETMGATFYPQMRDALVAAGASEADFEPLTEHLIRMVMEQGPFTDAMANAQFELIGQHFNSRLVNVKVTNGVVEAITFAPKSGA